MACVVLSLVDDGCGVEGDHRYESGSGGVLSVHEYLNGNLFADLLGMHVPSQFDRRHGHEYRGR